ncbi:hypothetical protein ScPMuIL_018990 [Solemya velum]
MDLATTGPVVLDTLTKACSQNAETLKPAEHQLQEWETQPGFYTILSTIFTNHTVDVNVRWLAVLYCKNGVDKYWRKSAPHAISEEEKEGMKKRLISDFSEPVHQVATQIAVLIGKVARLDCPRNWSELLPTIFQAVRCPEHLLQERALLVLHHVTKTLASKRLTADRKLFEELTNEIFSFILGLWRHHLDQLMVLASQHDDSMLEMVDKCVLTLKILRKLVAYGIHDPGSNPDAVNFHTIIFARLKDTLDCRRSLWGNHIMLEKFERLILTMTKVLLDLLELHPVSFLQFVHTTLELVVKYNFTETVGGLLFERFTVNSFNLMKGILFCDTYRPSKNMAESTDAVRMEAYKIKTNFFTFNMLAEICRRLISQYFLLNSDDLITWDEDPEQFCQEEGGDSYKYSLRPCTEVLFLTLFKEYRLSLTPVLLEMVKSFQGQCDPEDMVFILRKDAVYNAVGLAAFDLFDEINFDEWFSTHLLNELRNKHVNYRIIRRRVIWLVGQWVGVKMSVSLRPVLYEAILPLLNEKEDMVVRLEAANTLKTDILSKCFSLLDDFEFNTDQFLPYLDSSFTLLFQLLKEVNECDSKMQVLHVISFVIERVGYQIRPYTTSLVQYLPSLWLDSSQHNMLRCAILTTLIHLVQGFGSLCTTLYHFLLPVIHSSTDASQDQHVYLMEDGLELWQVTLQNSPVIDNQLLNLFHNMPALLELGTENLRVCLKIIEAYLILGPQEFMHQYSDVLVGSLSSLLTDLRTEGVVLILRVIELVFKTFPNEGPQVFRPLLPKLLKSTLDKEEHPVVMSMYLTLFGRILLQNRDYMWMFLKDVSPDFGKDTASILGCLIDVWLDKIDGVTQPERRKLLALAVASVLTVNLSPIVERFGSIINLCVEVLHDVCRIPVDEDTAVQLDSLVITDRTEVEEEQETELDKRKRMLSKRDPVHTVALREYVISQLTLCQQMHGQAGFEHLMEQVDPEIIQQLQSFTK